jgi:hypothetical protein
MRGTSDIEVLEAKEVRSECRLADSTALRVKPLMMRSPGSAARRDPRRSLLTI